MKKAVKKLTGGSLHDADNGGGIENGAAGKD
jgi:hypothetical protein